MPGTTTLADIAGELYALVPDEFVAARDAAARKARDSGERELAGEVKQLRRPSIGAWLVNQLAREQPDRLGELLDLGTELREAQDALDGAELRTMSRRRHEVIRALSGLATELAAAAGQRVGDAAQREFEATLDAALADEYAAEAVRTGRLMRTLTSTGLEAVDLTAAIAGPVGPPPARHRRASALARTTKPARSPTRANKGAKTGSQAHDASPAASTAANKRGVDRTGREARQQAVADARVEVQRTAAELTDREDALAAARRAVEEIRSRMAELEAALDEAATQRVDAERVRRNADGARKAAGRARDAAQRVLDTAQKRLPR